MLFMFIQSADNKLIMCERDDKYFIINNKVVSIDFPLTPQNRFSILNSECERLKRENRNTYFLTYKRSISVLGKK